MQLKGGELFAILQKSLFRVSYLSPIGNCNDYLLYIHPLIRVIGYLKRPTFSALPTGRQSGYDFVSEKVILSFLDMSEKGMSF